MMRANNPVLSDKNFQEKAAGEGWVAPQQGAFDAGSSSTREATQGRRMTIGGSMTATGVLLVLLVASGAFGWSQVDQSFQTINNPNGTVTVVNNSTAPWWIWAGMFGAFVLGMITVFVPKAARFTAPVYCLAYGMGLGAISAFFNGMWNGIVAQAVLVTMGVVVVMFLLYALRIVKVTPKLVIGIIAATGGVFLMYLVADRLALRGEPVLLEQPDAARHRRERADLWHRRLQPAARLRLHRAGQQGGLPRLHGVVRRLRAHRHDHLALHQRAAPPRPAEPALRHRPPAPADEPPPRR